MAEPIDLLASVASPSAIPARAPDVLEPIIAFRTWRVAAGELRSPFVPQRWDGGVVTAHCHRGDPVPFRWAADLLPFEHASPHPGCRCGIHAYFEPRSAVSGVDFRRVLGIVAVWGRMEIHAEGVRAEFATIEALGVSPAWSSWHRDAVAGIADALDVALVDEDALAEVARSAARRPTSPVPPPTGPDVAKPRPRRA